MTNEERDLRDRLIRLEEQMKTTRDSVQSMDRKMWAVIALVFVAVGKRLIEIMGIGP